MKTIEQRNDHFKLENVPFVASSSLANNNDEKKNVKNSLKKAIKIINSSSNENHGQDKYSNALLSLTSATTTSFLSFDLSPSNNETSEKFFDNNQTKLLNNTVHENYDNDSDDNLVFLLKNDFVSHSNKENIKEEQTPSMWKLNRTEQSNINDDNRIKINKELKRRITKDKMEFLGVDQCMDAIKSTDCNSNYNSTKSENKTDKQMEKSNRPLPGIDYLDTDIIPENMVKKYVQLFEDRARSYQDRYLKNLINRPRRQENLSLPSDKIGQHQQKNSETKGEELNCNAQKWIESEKASKNKSKDVIMQSLQLGNSKRKSGNIQDDDDYFSDFDEKHSIQGNKSIDGKFKELAIEEESLIDPLNNDQISPESSSSVSRASSTRSNGDTIEYHRLRSLEPNKSYLHKVSNMFQNMYNTLDSRSVDNDSKYMDIPNEVKQLAKVDRQLHSTKLQYQSIKRRKCQRRISIAVRIHHGHSHSTGLSTLKRKYIFSVQNFSGFLARMESILPKEYQAQEKLKNFKSKSFNSHQKLSTTKVKRSKSIDTARINNHIKNTSFCHPSRSLSLNLIEETHEDYSKESDQKLSIKSSTLQSSLQKTCSKGRESLDCFLTKNILENGHLSLQSNQPWLNFIKANHKKMLVDNLTKKQLNFYESMFEIIITEKIYLMQLERGIKLPSTIPSLSHILSQYDRSLLFRNLQVIYDIHVELYEEFIRAFQRNYLMFDIFGILERFLREKFEPYIDYIRSQDNRDSLMKNPALLVAIPEDIKTMQSLFIMPMQRITRYPLLLNTILERLSKFDYTNELPDLSKIKTNIETCFEAAKKFSLRCDGALNELIKLESLIEFRQRLIGQIPRNFVTRGREVIKFCPIKIIKCTKWLDSQSNEFTNIKLKYPMLILLTDLLILCESRQKKNQYNVIQLEKLDRVEIVKGTLFSPPSLMSKNTTCSALPTTPQSARRIEWPKNNCNPNTITFINEKETTMYQFHFVNNNELEEFCRQFKELKFTLRKADSQLTIIDF